MISALSQRISNEIARSGPVSFGRFMELALYDPDDGYYERSTNPIGTQGDFITSVSCGRLFGALLAEKFLLWCEPDSSPNDVPITLLECGSHRGQMALDMLDYLREFRPEWYSTIEYRIVEPSLRRKSLQESMLADHISKIRWHYDWEDIPEDSIRGVIFSNELLDALPYERISWDAQRQRWYSWSVTQTEGAFTWTPSTSASTAVQEFTEATDRRIKDLLPDGFTTEISPAANAWWQTAARRLAKGRLVAIDYGLTLEQRLSPHRAEGTLRAYQNHRLTDDVLSNPGEQDITAHVDFTALEQAGQGAGLTHTTLESQESFLTHILSEVMQRDPNARLLQPDYLKQFQTLTHPNHFGRAFSVFVQQRC